MMCTCLKCLICHCAPESYLITRGWNKEVFMWLGMLWFSWRHAATTNIPFMTQKHGYRIASIFEVHEDWYWWDDSWETRLTQSSHKRSAPNNQKCTWCLYMKSQLLLFSLLYKCFLCDACLQAPRTILKKKTNQISAPLPGVQNPPRLDMWKCFWVLRICWFKSCLGLPIPLWFAENHVIEVSVIGTSHMLM